MLLDVAIARWHNTKVLATKFERNEQSSLKGFVHRTSGQSLETREEIIQALTYPGSTFIHAAFVDITCKSKVCHHRNVAFPQQNVPAGQVTMYALQNKPNQSKIKSVTSEGKTGEIVHIREQSWIQ